MVSGPETYYDFSPTERDVLIVEEEGSTSLYFSDHKNLSAAFGQYKGGITVVCCEKSDDLFDVSKHMRLQMRFRDDENWVGIALQQ